MAPDATSSSEDAYRFIVELCEAIQVYGLSTQDSWDSVTRLAGALHWNVRFIATPNNVQAALWTDQDDAQHIRYITRHSGNYELSKLADIQKLMSQVEAGDTPPGEAVRKLRQIVGAPSPYGSWWDALAYVLCGLGFAVLLRGSWLDIAFGGLLSLVSFGTAYWASRSKGVAPLMEVLAAMICTMLACLLADLVAGIDPAAVTVAAVVYFVPGFGLTIAPNEFIKGNTLSGLVWLANASGGMLKLLGGAILGVAIAAKLLPVTQLEPAVGVSPLWAWGSVPLLVIGLAILFRVAKRQLVWTILGAWVVWGGVQLGNLFGTWQGTFIGTVALVVFAHACYRLVQASTAAIILPGIMLLVPGVATLRALYAAQTEGVAAGLQSASQIIALIAAILVGVLAGTAINASRALARRPKSS